jgi:hypothetical protein
MTLTLTNAVGWAAKAMAKKWRTNSKGAFRIPLIRG